MSKLSATLSKKVPIPGLEYSSQQFSCGLEMELSGEQTQESIRQNIRKLYVLLHTAIDEEIQHAIANPPMFMNSLHNAASRPQTSPDGNNNRWKARSYGDDRQNRWDSQHSCNRRGYGGNSNGGNSGRATQAQVKAIFAISKNNGIDRRDLQEMLEERFNIGQPDQLSIKQASKVIETLKGEGDRE